MFILLLVLGLVDATSVSNRGRLPQGKREFCCGEEIDGDRGFYLLEGPRQRLLGVDENLSGCLRA